MRRGGATLLLGILVAALAGCQGPTSVSIPSTPPISVRDPVASALYGFHAAWRGVPYRLGGLSRQGVDCSGLVYLVYRSLFDRKLPRHTSVQLMAGQPVPQLALRAGDLVFFQTSRASRHVGIYVADRTFLHASTSQGVMLSTLDERYWAQRYLQGVRVDGNLQGDSTATAR